MGEADEPTNGRRAWTGSRRSMCKPDVHTNLEDGRLDSHAVFGAALATFSSRSNPFRNVQKPIYLDEKKALLLPSCVSNYVSRPPLTPARRSCAFVPSSTSLVPGTWKRSDTATNRADICLV